MIAIIFWICIGSIVYTYAGYPVILAFVAQICKKPGYFPTLEEPTVTLLIAAYNEQTFIMRKLENSLSLDYPFKKLQIIVAADGSDDQTPDIVRAYAEKGVELIYQPFRKGKMAAINRAVQLAKGEIIVFSDANNMYEAGTLRALALPFSDPTVGGVSGAKYIIKGNDALSESEGLYWKYESFIKKQETRLGSCTGVNGEIFAIRRSLFEPALDGIINDDFYLAMRLLRRGFRVVYSPLARSFERVSLSAVDEITRRTRINAGRYQSLNISWSLLPITRPVLLWQIISHKFLRLFVPFAMIGALLSNLMVLAPVVSQGDSSLLRLSLPYNWIIFSLQIIFYLTAWFGTIAKLPGKIGKVLYVSTFLVNSNLAALQGFIGYVSGSQTALWKRVKRAEDKEDGHA